MTRVASIDCGTNTIKLLVADLDRATGREHQLAREMRIVRLGQDVDRTGLLSKEALSRTFAAVEEYAAIIEDHGVDAVRFCATSAARDASNGEVFRDGVRQRLGVDPEVLTGDEEAQLSYDGATRTLSDVPAPILVVDIGGGSTELILGDAHGHVRAARSLDIGSVRLTERLMPSDPPTAEELAAATKAVDEALDTLADHDVRIGDAGTVVGVAGTITTLATIDLELDEEVPEIVDGHVLPAETVERELARLAALPLAERRQVRGLMPERAPTIVAGAAILAELLRAAKTSELTVSERDILHGAALEAAELPR
jgi:exopolyphosphatase/guanosine-5'-triphosphate,3'-diphosphate pyrophosphatase